MFRRLLAPILSVALLAAPAGASEEDAASLGEALRLSDVFAVMSDEGHAYGRHLEEDMFPGSGGRQWEELVRNIYAPDRMIPDFNAAFEAELARQPADIAAMLDFFSSDLGRRVTTLEISARRALLDEAVEDASRLKLEEMRAERDPRLSLVEEFVVVNDLVETNVSGGLNANFAFYRGLGDAGALGAEMGEAEILSEVWAQEDAIREETDVWIHSYLAMAYAPLSDAEMADYIAFSRSKPGQDLNRALFAGYNAVFVNVSRQLGQAAGAVLAGQDL